MTEVTVVTYLCRDCGAKDRVKYFENEGHVQPLNCMSCHAKDSMYIVAEEESKYNQVEFQPQIVDPLSQPVESPLMDMIKGKHHA